MHWKRPIARAYRKDEVPVFEHSVVIEGDMVMAPIERDNLSAGEQLDRFVNVKSVWAHRDPGVIRGPQKVCLGQRWPSVWAIRLITDNHDAAGIAHLSQGSSNLKAAETRPTYNNTRRALHQISPKLRAQSSAPHRPSSMVRQYFA